jgi:hypothetical protein
MMDEIRRQADRSFSSTKSATQRAENEHAGVDTRFAVDDSVLDRMLHCAAEKTHEKFILGRKGPDRPCIRRSQTTSRVARNISMRVFVVFAERADYRGEICLVVRTTRNNRGWRFGRCLIANYRTIRKRRLRRSRPTGIRPTILSTNKTYRKPALGFLIYRRRD